MGLRFDSDSGKTSLKTGNLVFSIGFLGVVTAALTIPLMTWKTTHPVGAVLLILNVVVLSLILLWISKFR